jgi:hypothetical protein
MSSFDPDLAELNSMLKDALATAYGETLDNRVPWANAQSALASLGEALTSGANNSNLVVAHGTGAYEIRSGEQSVATIVRGESIQPLYNVCWNIWIGNRRWSIPNRETRFVRGCR